MGRTVPAIALILLLLLPAATYYFFDALQGFVIAERTATALDRHLRLLQGSEDAYHRYMGYVDRAGAFTTRARRAGTVEEAWDRYDVSLQEPMAFDELATILNQADHGPGYYFQPALLDIRLARAGGREEGTDEGAGDARLTLQGAFLVKKR